MVGGRSIRTWGVWSGDCWSWLAVAWLQIVCAAGTQGGEAPCLIKAISKAWLDSLDADAQAFLMEPEASVEPSLQSTSSPRP